MIKRKVITDIALCAISLLGVALCIYFIVAIADIGWRAFYILLLILNIQNFIRQAKKTITIIRQNHKSKTPTSN